MDPILAKYQELYSLSKDAVAQQVERIRRAEDKAAKFATLSALLMTLSALAGKFVLETFIPPKTTIGWICLVSYLFFLGALLYAYINILRSLRIITLDAPPMNKEMIEFFDRREYIDIIYALTRMNRKIIKKNEVVYSQKLMCSLRTYKALLLSVVFVSVFFTALVFWINHKPIKGERPCQTMITNPHLSHAPHKPSQR